VRGVEMGEIRSVEEIKGWKEAMGLDLLQPFF